MDRVVYKETVVEIDREVRACFGTPDVCDVWDGVPVWSGAHACTNMHLIAAHEHVHHHSRGEHVMEALHWNATHATGMLKYFNKHALLCLKFDALLLLCM